MNLERVATLLASGLNAVQVSTVVGCSPGRISQLLKEESFSLLYSTKLAEVETQDIEEVSLSAKYNAAEHELIKRVMELSAGAELRDVTASLRVIAERQERMKSRNSPTSPTSVQQQNTFHVSVSLPSHAIPTRVIEMSSQNEITSVEGRTLAPLPSVAVTALFHQMNLSVQQAQERGNREGDYHEQSPSSTSPKESLTEPLPQEESFLAFSC